MDVKLNEECLMVALRKLVRDLSRSSDLQEYNYETLWDIVESLSPTTFSTLHNNVYFADFLRQIYVSYNSVDLEKNDVALHQSKNSNDEFQLPLSEDILIVPNLATPLDLVQLPARFIKLFKRLRNISLNNTQFKVGNTLQDVVDLTENEVINLNGIGISYVETLKELKKLVNDQNGDFPELDEMNKEEFDLLGIDTSNYSISMYGVEQHFVKPLEKYIRHFKLSAMTPKIDDVLKFERDELLALPSFGRGAVDQLIEFKNIIVAEIRAIEQGEVDYMELQSKIIVPYAIDTMPLQQIEQVLLDDIDHFLDKLSDDEVDIAQSRWGFVEDKETLEEVGIRYELTRERIRQREAKINNQFISNLRVNPKSLWYLLEPHMEPQLKDQVPDLFNCFSSERAFYEFMEIVLQKEKLFEYIYPEVDKAILNSYFAENGAPLHIQDAITVIEESGLSSIKSSRNAIFNLQKQGQLVVEGEYLWPKLLSKSQASACVLVNQPKGLPWSDIAKLANKNGFSKSDIYEDRLDHEAFNNKDYIYLAGKGLYKHTRFINSDVISLDKMFSELSAYTANNTRDVFHLNECYQSSDYLKRFNYYEIRHFVKHFGEDYGFYFDGRSQADSVGRKKGFKNITQKDVIIEAMNKSERPFTKPEVANLLKSKSLGHASYYLDELMEAGSIVQVDHQLYTTPMKAYRNIDLPIYLNNMQNILEKCAKPVEASIFQQMLNPLFLVSYSKFFYASIARCFAAERGWYRAHGLYSIQPIQFNNLTDVVSTFCEIDDPIKVSVEHLQKHIAITKENASTVIHNWRNSHNRLHTRT
ncbi:sigma factor-like helix-turn-helix DNA-binding protein [Photobacterium sp. GB-50]|uniref:sigma factor-like helix-turn-helix DNA-binding protein n=1 Tax=Photobacterium sp. GB-50 TaxID=2022107 RepID=UPI0018ECCB45|nr:sigma factor-like helix-turn-helix DNA-binding protein [Photobacterium sp. GB-50]